MTEWEIRPWAVGQHCKVVMSVQSQVGAHSDMTLEVARM